MDRHERDRDRREFFDAHADQWLARHYGPDPGTGVVRFQAEIDRLLTLLGLRPDAHVLDVGSGAGPLVAHLLARLGPEGLLIENDYAPRMVAANRRLHADPRLRFLVEDAARLSLPDGSCDVVLCHACFPHFEDKPAALRELVRVLRPGGRLVVAHFMSSTEIAAHHGKHPAVAQDRLPDEEGMRGLLAGERLQVEAWLDEPGFYFLGARKPR